jgi:hypothetical protein
VVVTKHISEVVVEFKIPENLERRFEWLSAGDSLVKQQLLNYFRNIEKALVVEGARTQLSVLLEHLQSERGRHTYRLAQILKVGNHELELMLDRSASGVSVHDPALFRPSPSRRQGFALARQMEVGHGSAGSSKRPQSHFYSHIDSLPDRCRFPGGTEERVGWAFVRRRSFDCRV